MEEILGTYRDAVALEILEKIEFFSIRNKKKVRLHMMRDNTSIIH